MLLHSDCPLCSPLFSWGWAYQAVNATRRWTTSKPTNGVQVKLHFANAFNTLFRDSLLEVVARDNPGMLPFHTCLIFLQTNVKT